MNKYMPYELVEEILKWMPTEKIYMIRTLCKRAHVFYNNRIKSATGLEIKFKNDHIYKIRLFSEDFSISKIIRWEEGQSIDLATFFPPSILYLGLFSCDASFIDVILKNSINIQELYFSGRRDAFLTFDLLKPLKKLALIHFGPCGNPLKFSDIGALGIYGLFSHCCGIEPVIFPQNNHHSNTKTIDELIKNKGYKYHSYNEKDKYVLLKIIYENTPKKMYTYKSREIERFYANFDIADFFGGTETKVFEYKKLPDSILQMAGENGSFYIKNKKGRIRYEEGVAPPGVLPRIYK